MYLPNIKSFGDFFGGVMAAAGGDAFAGYRFVEFVEDAVDMAKEPPDDVEVCDDANVGANVSLSFVCCCC